MICTEPGAALSVFLSVVTARSEQFTEVIFCAPFIDTPTARRLGVLARRARVTRCGITIITASQGHRSLSRVLSPADAFGVLKITLRRDLHAKAYLAMARGPGTLSEAMVTSANLTSAAFSKNQELGVRVTSRSPHGRALLHQIRHALSQLSN
jgi:hypothetical protein